MARVDPRDAAGGGVPLRRDLADRPRAGLLPQLGLRRPRRAGAAARVVAARRDRRARASCSCAARTSRSAASTTSAATAARSICDDEQGEVRTHLRCPYHAWGYALDGTLVTTPMIEKDEIDRERRRCGRCTSTSGRASSSSTSPARSRAPLLEHLADQQDDALELARVGLAELRIGHVSTIDVAGQLEDRARELQRVPALPDDPPRAGGRGAGVQEGQHLRERPRGRRGDAGRRPHGDGRSTRGCGCRCCPGFKGQGDPAAYFGAGVYPTMFLDVDGSTCLATAVFPTGPRSCRLVTEYLFSPEALEDPELRPVAGGRVQRAGDPAGQRGLRARAARRHLTRVRPRRLPGQGRLGLRASTSATCATSRR